MRIAIILAFVPAFVVAAQREAPTIRPTTVTLHKDNASLREVVAELSRSPAGVAVKVEHPELAKATCALNFDKTLFWEALETAADRTKSRLTLRDGGSAVWFEPRTGNREISAVSGPFRIVARAVTGRLLLDQGLTFHDVELDVHWEPRVPVFRIDTQPRITKAEDDRGTALRSDGGSARHYPTSPHTDMKFRLMGLTRESKQIATVAGEFRATAAEELLKVPFKNLGGKFPMKQTVSGVQITVESFEKIGGMWEAKLELTYPEGHPNFESFEEGKWLRDNRLRVVGPDAAVYDPDSDDVVASGRRVSAIYRFKLLANANPLANGWSLVCETPSPLMEVKVPFVLKNIPIP